MPYITQKQFNELCQAEDYFWDNSDWKENEETEKALYRIWNVVEELTNAHIKQNKRAREYMRMKRKTDPKYDRRKKENKNYGRK